MKLCVKLLAGRYMRHVAQRSDPQPPTPTLLTAMMKILLAMIRSNLGCHQRVQIRGSGGLRMESLHDLTSSPRRKEPSQIPTGRQIPSRHLRNRIGSPSLECHFIGPRPRAHRHSRRRRIRVLRPMALASSRLHITHLPQRPCPVISPRLLSKKAPYPRPVNPHRT